jgi:hypothetical protein
MEMLRLTNSAEFVSFNGVKYRFAPGTRFYILEPITLTEEFGLHQGEITGLLVAPSFAAPFFAVEWSDNLFHYIKQEDVLTLKVYYAGRIINTTDYIKTVTPRTKDMYMTKFAIEELLDRIKEGGESEIIPLEELGNGK